MCILFLLVNINTYFIFKLLNTFHKFCKLTFIFSAIVTGWTSILLLSNNTFNLEINELLTKMYLNQKNFILMLKIYHFY